MINLLACANPGNAAWCVVAFGRWLFYFLARQKQAEAAIEAYKVVDKQALAQLSPTCLSELFRSLIDNEITTQVSQVQKGFIRGMYPEGNQQRRNAYGGLSVYLHVPTAPHIALPSLVNHHTLPYEYIVSRTQLPNTSPGGHVTRHLLHSA